MAPAGSFELWPPEPGAVEVIPRSKLMADGGTLEARTVKCKHYRKHSRFKIPVRWNMEYTPSQMLWVFPKYSFL
jgi:hypothetical protein